ncbi:MAG: polysaccharide deacetylase family protein [Bacteroidia bacterium]
MSQTQASQATSSHFLFSVDLEDVRKMIPDGLQYPERVPAMTRQYLAFLAQHQAKATFFLVGDMLRTYPDLIVEIADQGHEIACHTNKHTHLDQLSQDAFKRDLEAFQHSLIALGLPPTTGFRAPSFSLTEKTQWVYPLLKEFGFIYSSSVLPAKNPLFGWKDFGNHPRMIGGMLEIPMTLQNFGLIKIPIGGGVYFRSLPSWVLRFLFRQFQRQKQDILGYFHPYDIDLKQDRFMHPNIDNNPFFNALMYYGRASVFPKLKMVMDLGFAMVRYDDFAQQYLPKKLV